MVLWVVKLSLAMMILVAAKFSDWAIVFLLPLFVWGVSFRLAVFLFCDLLNRLFVIIVFLI